MVLIVGLMSWLVFLLFQPYSIFGVDSGDLVTAGYLGGVPHPPGFPLYTAILYVITHIPLFSVAWRAALLSSIPSALTCVFIYLLLLRVTKLHSIAVIGSIIYIGTYVIFLYSIVPEVFALNNLFIILLLYVSVLMVQTNRYYRILPFLLGLSLSHHHLILFSWIIPLIAFVKVKHTVLYPKKEIVIGILLFILGLLPYIYIPYAASKEQIINWEHATTLPSFFHLVGRSRYGLFKSSSFIGMTIYQRWLNVVGYARFLYIEFHALGIGLFIVGILSLLRTYKKYAALLLSGFIMTGIMYPLYASNILIDQLSFGIFERFLLQSYLYVSIIIAFGIYYLMNILGKIVMKHNRGEVVLFLFFCLISIFSISRLYFTLMKTKDLKYDKSFELLAGDYLDSVDKDAILLLSNDTTLFPVQYIRYVLNYRPDVYILFKGDMICPSYYHTIRHNFPGLYIPKSTDNNQLLNEFIKENAKKYQIYSNAIINTDELTSIQEGLLYKVYNKSDLPTYEKLIQKNLELFSKYHENSVYNGAVNVYQHYALVDAVHKYIDARMVFVEMLIGRRLFSDAKIFLDPIIDISRKFQIADVFKDATIIDISSEKCESALADLHTYRDMLYSEDIESYKTEALIYGLCFHDEKKSQELQTLYQSKMSELETKLPN